MYCKRTNSTKIQKPINVFPVSQNNLTAQPFALPPTCLQQRASGHHVGNSTCRKIFCEVLRNSPKCRQPTSCYTSSALILFLLSVILHTLCPGHEVRLNKAIGVLCLEWEVTGVCWNGRSQGCASFGGEIPFNFVPTFPYAI